MKFRLHPHRHADKIVPAEAPHEWKELTDALMEISDAAIIKHFSEQRRRAKSISEAINVLLRERLVQRGWLQEAPIFQDAEYTDKRWRLDFAKGLVSVEIAFNHGEAIAWNLLKPVLASEYNHIKKAIQTRVGVVVCATEALKSAGGFDSAVGTFEKFSRYLIPLQNPLSVPIMLVGLEAPETFRIVHEKRDGRTAGLVERFP